MSIAKSPLFEILKNATAKEAEEILKEKVEVQQIPDVIQDNIEPEVSIVQDVKSPEDIMNNYKRLFAIVNPKTGMRYDIPMVDRNKPGYFFEYVDCMKILERDPKTFKRMMEWN